MDELKDMTIEKLLDEFITAYIYEDKNLNKIYAPTRMPFASQGAIRERILSRFRKLTGKVSNLEESCNSMDRFAIKCMKELSDANEKIDSLEKGYGRLDNFMEKCLEGVGEKTARLEKALELACCDLKWRKDLTEEQICKIDTTFPDILAKDFLEKAKEKP